MKELLLIAVFAAALLSCVFTGVSILVALVFGYALFFWHGLSAGFGARRLLAFSRDGVKTVVVVLSAFALIGIVTAMWRACGTIAFIVYHAHAVCTPQVALLATFLLCSFVSFLTGTSFGTAATMGVICMTMATSMGVPPALAGGAMLGGVFFGDRSSPMSTSALIVCALTKTDLHGNLALMLRTAVVPFLLSCLLCLVLAPEGQPGGDLSIPALLAAHYNLHWVTVLPAVAIVVLALFRVGVKLSLFASLVCAFAVAILVQGMAPADALLCGLVGFVPDDPDIACLLGGGGVLSMAQVFFIVCISSSYAGLFHGTHFLDGLIAHVSSFARRATPFGAILATSVATSAVACNQTLAIMLTHQLCEPLADRRTLALHLENSVVLLSALIPWSIAGAVPLSVCGAPRESLLFAFYLYLVPLWALVREIVRRRHPGSASG